jgi:hypothetical protein
MKNGLLALAIGGIALISACGAPASADSWQPQSNPGQVTVPNVFIPPGPPAWQGPLSTPRHYLGGLVTLEAPPAGIVATKTWQQAFEVCVNRLGGSGTAPCFPTVSPEARLVLYTDNAWGYVGPGGTTVYPFQRRLTYTFTWQHVRCAPSGGPNSPSAPPPPTAPVCEKVVFVDANTGQFLDALWGAPST